LLTSRPRVGHFGPPAIDHFEPRVDHFGPRVDRFGPRVSHFRASRRVKLSLALFSIHKYNPQIIRAGSIGFYSIGFYSVFK
jgi:hypothetical protein